MIGFFRKIRKKLADDNKPMKYMRYAIGEILLVVIGILIALQINTWNTSRIDKNEEERYLNRLVVDLERDILNIQETIENYEKRLILGVNIVNKLGKNNAATF